MTEVITDIQLAASLLKKGEVVACPTETVYGLACAIDQKEAIEKIYALKKRPSDNPLIVHVSSLEMLDKVAYMDESFLKLYNAFMPGPLTVLLKKREGVLNEITRGLETVAVRFSSHPVFNALIEALGVPIAAPSANLSGKPSATCIEHVLEDFKDTLRYALDGGKCASGIESTIVRVMEDHAIILRPGIITKNQIEAVLNTPCIFAKKGEKVQAPGMKYRHYAPKAKIVITKKIKAIDFVEESTLFMAKDQINHPCFEKLSEENLYAAFRKADKMGFKTILIEDDGFIDEGLLNRIEKAKD